MLFESIHTLVKDCCAYKHANRVQMPLSTLVSISIAKRKCAWIEAIYSAVCDCVKSTDKHV